MKFPLYLPQINNPENNNLNVIAADVGGTKTNIAKFVSEDGKMVLVAEDTYVTNNYNMTYKPCRYTSACFAVLHNPYGRAVP